MEFYKILSKDEKHYDLQYKTGLNIDIVPFDPSGDCRSGGIYFSREDIFAFLDYGPWIRKVTIPEDARVYENPGQPKKWKADRVILGEREQITDEVIKRLISEGADAKVCNSWALVWAVNRENIKVVKLLLEAGADASADNSFALQCAIQQDYLEIVKVLFEKRNFDNNC
jgi:hypothetical protein